MNLLFFPPLFWLLSASYFISAALSSEQNTIKIEITYTKVASYENRIVIFATDVCVCVCLCVCACV